MFDITQVKRNVGKWTSHREEHREDEISPQPEPLTPVTQTLPAPTVRRSSEPAVIGPSIHIKGDLTGEEDLLIQGHVEGTINLKQHNLTIGQDGRINANVFAHTITVEGELRGDLVGGERVVIRKTGNVQGNITAPRVNVEDGAVFKGSVDMDRKRLEAV